MSEQNDSSKKFLNKFTEEMILSLKTNIEIDERKKIEEERMKRAIEVEKLKQKFSQYSEKPQQEISKINEIPKQQGIIQTQKIPQNQVIQEIKPMETQKIQQNQVVQQIPQKPQVQEMRPIESPKVIEKIEEIPAGFEKSIRQEKSAVGEIIKMPEKTVTPQKPIQFKKQELPVKNIQIPTTQPVEPGEVDFGKITFLVKDPLISYVECPGENKNVIIKRAGGLTTATQITLTKEEVSNIIHSFSEKARIPLIEGMLDARLSNLEMSAVISDSTSSSFIVKRNFLPPPRSETVLQRPIEPQATIQRPQMMMRPVMQPFDQQKNPNKI